MRLSLFLSLLVLLLFSCKKESNDFVWERSFGPGHAYFVESTADSGILSCGTLEGKPYITRLDKSKRIIFEYHSAEDGLYSSAWTDTSCCIAAGSSGEKMLVSVLGKNGALLWDTLMTASFNIDRTHLLYRGDGEFLAVGTQHPDSAVTVNKSGIFFARFDTAGNIAGTKDIVETGLLMVNDICVSGSGDIFLPVTRKYANRTTQASCMKYSPDLNKIWETELFNNPDFGSESLGILYGDDGYLYISGNTELNVEGGALMNSFLASVTTTGTVSAKYYIEKSNKGVSLLFENNGLIMMLNSNCFIINVINPDDGSETDRLRMFDVCDPGNSDALGSDFDLNFNSSLILAGSVGDRYYLAQKTFIQ